MLVQPQLQSALASTGLAESSRSDLAWAPASHREVLDACFGVVDHLVKVYLLYQEERLAVEVGRFLHQLQQAA